MPQLKRVFTSGKMNKDLDERLVPNGQYRDALNIQVSDSEGSDVGAVESVLGNIAKSNLFTNGVCIGSVKDTQNNRLYWFVTDDDGDYIYEYDEATDTVAPVIIDYEDQNEETVLNFDVNHLITGVNVLDGMLLWTDNYNEPRKILISRFKAGSTSLTNGKTTVYGRAFKNTDITVIKEKPKTAPTFTASASTRTGLGVGLSPVDFIANLTEYSTDEGAWVPFETGHSFNFTTDGGVVPNWQNGDIIIAETSRIDDDNFELEYKARLEITSGGGTNTLTVTVLSISQYLPYGNYTWSTLLEEDEPMFNLVVPRFAYRWKYNENEYSAFSPWTKPVFVPGDFGYNSTDALNNGMVNNIRKLVIDGFETPPDNVEVLEILYKSTSSNNIYVVDEVAANTTSFTITSELIYRVVESNQYIRPYDNVPRKAKAQEIIGNRVVYGNYVQNYDVDNTLTNISLNVNSSNITTPKTPEESIKSLRTYQVGVVYLDEYGRESPVFTNDTATVKVPKTSAKKVNTLNVVSSHTAPSWATHFKYYLKDTSNEYYNFILDRYYASDDGNVWLSVPSSERNKVQVGDFIYLKKKHNSDEAVDENAKYKILDIDNEVPTSVKTQRIEVAFAQAESGTITASQGTSTVTFSGPQATEDPTFAASLGQSNTWIRLRNTTTNVLSGYYKVIRGGLNGVLDTGDNRVDSYTIDLESQLGTEWQTPSSGQDVEIFVYEERIEMLPEFLGKFFIKINRDVVFENSILYNFTNDEKDYKIETNATISNILSESNDDPDLAANKGWAWSEFDDTPSPGMFANEIFAPVAGTKTFGFGWIRYENGDETNTSLGYMIDNLEAGATVQLKDYLGNWSPIVEVESVVKGISDRSPVRTPNQEYYYFTVTVKNALGPTFGDGNTNPATGFRVLKRKRNLPIIFDEYTRVLSSPNPAVFETEPKETAELDIYYEATDAIAISNLGNPLGYNLNYFNCYSFGNGVESDRIRDDFNAVRLGKGVKVSAVLDEPYAEEVRGSGMIYSGIFNSTSGLNELNQFISGLKITKDLNPIYGTIQKLHARDTDLIALCEDKVFRILANKDALYNADGNTNVTSNNNVLGQTTPYVGEYGISKNPESFVSFGFRVYFTDKARRAVIRLSRDGITEISSKGMSDYITDALTSHTGFIHGSFDEDNSSYNVTINGETLSFKENVDGWPTRFSFIQENGLSLNNIYYTFSGGELYSHTNNTRSNFYGTQYNTSVTLIHNDEPSSIKNFKTLSYEGDDGWTATVDTDQQDGEVVTWKNKEGIYYNYIRGRVDAWDNATQTGSLDTSEFSVQGIDTLDIVGTVTPTMELIFNNEINVSLQEAADDLVFYQKSNGNVYKIGNCTDISKSGSQWIVSVNNTEGILYDSGGTSIEDGDFIFFVKNSQINTSGLVGYYASVKMTQTTGNNKELFAVNSEIFVSS